MATFSSCMAAAGHFATAALGMSEAEYPISDILTCNVGASAVVAPVADTVGTQADVSFSSDLLCVVFEDNATPMISDADAIGTEDMQATFIEHDPSLPVTGALDGAVGSCTVDVGGETQRIQAVTEGAVQGLVPGR